MFLNSQVLKCLSDSGCWLLWMPFRSQGWNCIRPNRPLTYCAAVITTFISWPWPTSMLLSPALCLRLNNWSHITHSRQLTVYKHVFVSSVLLNRSLTWWHVPAALSELQSILVHSKNCKMNTLFFTKCYAELTATKCSVFRSLHMSIIRMNVEICIRISLYISCGF